MTKAILTDIEGTTTSIRFVFDVLFPYAREHIAGYLSEHADTAAVGEQLKAVSAEVGRELGLDEAIAQLIVWIDADRKVTPLKALQGMIWEAGYREGDFTGHVYPDAVEKLREWHDAGLDLYVYSSGSVQAQKLLFGFSDAGDLTPLFKGYYDTRVGGKREADSYRRIAGEIGLPAGEILFLSDIVEELDAAREAGMQTCRLVREGEPDPTARHCEVADFSVIQP